MGNVLVRISWGALKPPDIIWNITRYSSYPSTTLWIIELWATTPSSYHDKVVIWVFFRELMTTSTSPQKLDSFGVQFCHYFVERFHFCFFQVLMGSTLNGGDFSSLNEICILRIDWKNFRNATWIPKPLLEMTWRSSSMGLFFGLHQKMWWTFKGYGLFPTIDDPMGPNNNPNWPHCAQSNQVKYKPTYSKHSFPWWHVLNQNIF